MTTVEMNLATKELTAPAWVGTLRNRGLIAGLIFAVLAAIGAFVNFQTFMHAYLMGFIFCLSLCLGGLALVMLGHLTGGNWFMMGRRIMEAQQRTLPLLAVFFIPIAVFKKQLYLWAAANSSLWAANDAVMHWKTVRWLYSPFFEIRAVIYFLIWGLWIWKLNSGSRQQDTNPDPRIWQTLKAWAAPGILVYGLTITFAAVDWVMSLDAHWFSTIYGMLFMAHHMLVTFAFVIIMLILLTPVSVIGEVMFKDRLHDFGKLIFALTMVWGYFSFSQFLIIWSGNLPEEIGWFLVRTNNGWGVAALLLVIGQFALPFILLLFRDIKRDAKKLIWVAVLVILMRWFDTFWLVVPNPWPGRPEAHAAFSFNWMYAIVPLAMAGIWLAYFAMELAKRPLLVRNDPQLPRLWEHSHGH
jgi:hypothetical protein